MGMMDMMRKVSEMVSTVQGNVDPLKAPAGGVYKDDPGICEVAEGPQGLCMMPEPVKAEPKPAAKDTYVADFFSKMRQMAEVAKLREAMRTKHWYEEVWSNLTSASKWKELPGNMLAVAAAPLALAGCNVYLPNTRNTITINEPFGRSTTAYIFEHGEKTSGCPSEYNPKTRFFCGLSRCFDRNSLSERRNFETARDEAIVDSISNYLAAKRKPAIKHTPTRTKFDSVPPALERCGPGGDKYGIRSVVILNEAKMRALIDPKAEGPVKAK